MVKLGFRGGVGGGSLSGKLFGKRKEAEEEEEVGPPPIRRLSRSGGGRVVGSYSVGLARVYIVERGPSLFYEVEEPPVSDKDLRRLRSALDAISEELEDPSLFTDPGRREEASKFLRSALAKRGIKSEALIYYAEREMLGYGVVDVLLRDKKLENVECKGPGKPVDVVHVDYDRIPTNITFTREELDRLVQRLVFKAGKSISVANPKVDNALLPGVGRLTATFGGEITPDGSSFVVRIFPERPWTILGFLERNTVSPEVAAYLWLAVEWKMPILIAGAMGTGKTSYANAILGMAPPERRIGTAEDVPEFRIPHPNWQRLITQEQRGIQLFDLVKYLLRANVDYVVINEIRGHEDSKAWFQAVSTGHGGVTTIHADTVESVFNRLEDLGIPAEYLTSLALVVFIGKFKIGGKIQRRTQYVFDIINPAKREYTALAVYDAATDSYKLGDLLSARTTKRILELSKLSPEEFLKEWRRRAEFLRRLMALYAADRSVGDVDRLFEYFKRYYRGQIPDVPATPAAKAPEAPKATPRPPGAEWVVKFAAPRGRKVFRFKPIGGLTLLTPEVVETEDEVVEVALRGSGVLEYVVESGGRAIGRGRVPIGGTAQVEEVPRAKSEVAGEEEGTLVLEGTETKVLEVSSVSSLCLKFGDFVLPLREGEFGRADFERLGPASATVSRRHFKIEQRGGSYYIIDLGSKNGTSVNGVRLRPGEPTELKEGYGVKIGGLAGVVAPC